MQRGRPALVLSQLVFLLPVAMAAIAAEIAFFVGPPSPERKAWGLVSLTVMVLLMSEGYYSWYQVTQSPAGPPAPSPYDVLNLLAALMIAGTLAMLTGVGRLTLADRLRVSFDVVAVSSLVYIALYHAWVRPMSPDSPWGGPALWTGYAFVGLMILAGTLWLGASASPGTERSIAWLVGTSLAIFGLGMVLTPLWRSATSSGTGSSIQTVGFSCVYLLGYYLLMLAGLVRLRDRDMSWRGAPKRPITTNGVWATTLLSLLVLVAVSLIAWWAYHYPAGESETLIYVVAGLLGTIGLVARTGVTAVESAVLRDAGDVDSVTGAFNHRAFQVRADTMLEAGARGFTPVTFIVFDMDRFAHVNSSLGHAAGDEVLAQVVGVALQAMGGNGELFRLSADEFVAVASVDEDRGIAIANEMLAAIREIVLDDGTPLSASFGVAGCQEAPCGREELLRRADAAQAWAKYHGKSRVVRFDERIVRALGVEERLRERPERSALELARHLSSAADARDPRNYYHSRNVAALSVLLSEALRLDAERISRVEIAAMLHDCGKLCLPDELLADVLLSSRQQLAVRAHAELGGQLVVSVGDHDISPWVRHHHERWDGSGYPSQLAGEDIPLEARIIALADAYDAMTSGTRHHAPLSRGAALQEIDFGMGSRFDPLLAELFIEVVGATMSLGWSDEWSVA
jgi:diguanylate cyclase (GGDEF)-like protein